MDYTDEFNASNEQLKKLDRESLHKELNQMSLDELLERMNWCINQSMEEGDCLSEDELNRQIEMLKDRIEYEEVKRKGKQQKTVKIKKVAVLAAAIVVVVSVFSVFAIASKNNIDIKNGVVKFFHNTVSIFFLEKKDYKGLAMTEVIEQLHEYGFDDLCLPSELFSTSFSFSSVSYIKQEYFEQVKFRAKEDNLTLSIRIINDGGTSLIEKDFKKLKNATTIEKDGFCIYIFEYEDGNSQINYTNFRYSYEIYGHAPLEKMINVAETI